MNTKLTIVALAAAVASGNALTCKVAPGTDATTVCIANADANLSETFCYTISSTDSEKQVTTIYGCASPQSAGAGAVAGTAVCTPGTNVCTVQGATCAVKAGGTNDDCAAATTEELCTAVAAPDAATANECVFTAGGTNANCAAATASAAVCEAASGEGAANACVPSQANGGPETTNCNCVCTEDKCNTGECFVPKTMEIRYPEIDFTECCGDDAKKTSFLTACTTAQIAGVTCSDVEAGSAVITFSGSADKIATAKAAGAQPIPKTSGTCTVTANGQNADCAAATASQAACAAASGNPVVPANACEFTASTYDLTGAASVVAPTNNGAAQLFLSGASTAMAVFATVFLN